VFSEKKFSYSNGKFISVLYSIKAIKTLGRSQVAAPSLLTKAVIDRKCSAPSLRLFLCRKKTDTSWKGSWMVQTAGFEELRTTEKS
jgi:hypothetical protein